jgi:hypothetical protein
MSTDLVVLGQQQLAVGGLELGSKLFQLKPATLELVQKMTRQEGALPGKLRVTATNEHFDVMHVVMLFAPVEQRSYFKGEEFSRDSKLCFSLDAIKPHQKAKEPQAYVCNGCPKGDWSKYMKTKERADMPPCRNYYHLVLADRVTQMPYYLNVKGASIRPFETAMQNVARLIAMMQATGKKPSIFDISFKIYPVAQGANYVLGFKEIAPLKDEDRDAFGALYLDFVNRKAQGSVVSAEDAEAEAANATAASVDAAVTEAPAGVVSGTVVGKEEPITI